MPLKEENVTADHPYMEVRCEWIDPNDIKDVSEGYLISNEKHPEAFYTALDETPSGIYLGLGFAQNYLFMKRCKPTNAIICDGNKLVMAFHNYTEMLFRETANQQEFNTSIKKVSEDLEYDYLTGQKEKWLRMIRGPTPYLKKILESSFSEHVHRLYKENNIELLCADIFAKNTMDAIAEMVRKTGERITTLYLSNALNNIYVAPMIDKNLIERFADETVFDPEARVLQTLNAGKEFSYPDDSLHWHYSCLSMRKFLDILEKSIDGNGLVTIDDLALEKESPTSCIL